MGTALSQQTKKTNKREQSHDVPSGADELNFEHHKNGDEVKDDDSTKVDEEDKEKVGKLFFGDARKAFMEGNRLFREGRFDLAKTQYATALKFLKAQDSPKDDVSKVTALSNIAILDFADGRYEQAKELLEEALALRKGWMHRKLSPSTATEGMEAVSTALAKDNPFCRTPEEHKQLAKEIKEHGAVDAVIADTINNLAACLEILGYLDEAKKMYEESLTMRMAVHGNHSLKVAESMQNLATILDSQGYLREAEHLLEQSLAIQKSISGENSPEAAVSMNNLGVLCTHLGQFDRAEKLLEDTVTTRVLYYGDDHQLTICAKRNLQYVKNKRQSLAQRPLLIEEIEKKIDDTNKSNDGTNMSE